MDISNTRKMPEAYITTSDLEGKIQEWWSNLQKERKLNSTINIAKIVKLCHVEDQVKAPEIICKYIKQSISCSTKDIVEMQAVCNAINGCFDNFAPATRAANIAFNDIINFIDLCIDECKNQLTAEVVPKCLVSKILELLHCLSRILVLNLKLKRSNKNKCDAGKISLHPEVKLVLTELSLKISRFLKMDEVLMDTKCNFAMSSLLIREIIVKQKIKLLQYHNEFLCKIPDDIEEKDYKLNILQFLLGSAILNIWSDVVIDEHSISVYLKFFIQMCECYSSDTATILNISRALLLLVKNECFKDFVSSVDGSDSHQIKSLLSCVWMLLDHPVACVRHSSKDFLRLLVAHDKFKMAMRNSLPNLSCEKRSYFNTLAALANELGSRDLVEADKDLPRNLLSSAYDPTLVSHVVWALENMIINDVMVEENFEEWCEIWIVPLLSSLSNVPLVVAGDIEKLLHGLFKQFPSAIFYIIRKWSEPKNDDELRCIITSLKIYNRHGLKKMTCPELKEERQTNDSIAGTRKEKWKGLISEKLLEICLHHSDDDIRVSAFSLLVQGPKSTEIYSDQDFTLIQYFLIYNLNNQHPSTRQKILSLLKKMVDRYYDGLTVIKRQDLQRKKLFDSESSGNGDVARYTKFQDWLIKFCFSNIFDGANFNRLNTVLSLLLLFIDCKETVQIDSCDAEMYWRKILISLKSSYEENKVMAVELSRKLNVNKSLTGEREYVKKLFRRAFELCGQMEPPNVLTGSYLVQVLIECPGVESAVMEFLPDDVSRCDVKLMCVSALVERLKGQTENARKNLVLAAANGPMYGILFALRLIFQGIDFCDIDDNMELGGTPDTRRNTKENWKGIINDLIDLSFDMIHVVSCVVNSSSPEGHLPSDFQTDFDFTSEEGSALLSVKHGGEGGEGSFSAEFELVNQQLEDMKFSCVAPLRRARGIPEDCELLIKTFNRLYLSINYASSFSQKNLEDLNDLHKNCIDLLLALDSIRSNEDKHDANNSNDRKMIGYLRCLNLIKDNLEEIIPMCRKNAMSDAKPTAQVLLLCAWRSIKEACLFLGDLVSKLPLEKTLDMELITEETVMKIGQELRTLLCEIKHRGAFEQAYVGFIQLANSLWKCPRKKLNELPMKWLREILHQLECPLENQKLKLCPTRRSAGLPFLVQAIISSELQHIKSAKIETLDLTMNTLLQILETRSDLPLDSRIHSLNILRGLFKHAMLGEHVAPYVSRAVMVAIRGSRASAWSERNSSSLLFSSLVIRIFGVARNKDALSKKNRMTSRTFFQRYPELYEFFLGEMKASFRGDSSAHECYPQPNVFLILLILGRLYPPPVEDTLDIDFSEFLPLLNISCRNAILKIRELGARAMVPLIPGENLKEELSLRFSSLYRGHSTIDNNEMHGILLQLKSILTEMSFNESPILKESLAGRGSSWIEKTSWILSATNSGQRRVSYLIKISYLHVLHAIFNACPAVRGVIVNAVNKKDLFSEAEVEEKGVPGYFVYMETLNFLRFDAAVSEWRRSDDDDQLIDIILSMLKSKIDDVQAVPLRVCHYITSCETEENLSEDDVNSLAVRVKDLSCLQDEESRDALRIRIFYNSRIIECIANYFALLLSNAGDASIVIHKVNVRLWMCAMSAYMLEDAIPVEDACDRGMGSSLAADSLSSLINCGDLDISVNAFAIFCIKFFSDLARDSERVTGDSVEFFVKLIFSFSDPAADVKQRAMVSKIFNRYHSLIEDDFFKKDNLALSIWILPLRLILDDDSTVRRSAMGLVSKYNFYLREHPGRQKSETCFDEVTSSQLTTVPLKAQELLLDCYVNVFFNGGLLHLVVQMVAWALSACSDATSYESISGENEIGVFEKGNPNPFCEELAFSSVICGKLKEIREMTDMGALLREKLLPSHVSSLKYFLPTLTLPDFPDTLGAVVDKVFDLFGSEDPEPDSRTMTMLSLQIRQLRKALDL